MQRPSFQLFISVDDDDQTLVSNDTRTFLDKKKESFVEMTKQRRTEQEKIGRGKFFSQTDKATDDEKVGEGGKVIIIIEKSC